MLSGKHGAWADEIGASPDLLFQEQSVATVRHALSKAVSRAPQRVLWEAAEPHAAAMLEKEHGAAILESLVKFGTQKTVGAICVVVEAHKPEALALSEFGTAIFAAIIGRQDEEHGERSKLLAAVVPTVTKAATLVKSAPARQLFAALAADSDFAEVIAGSLGDAGLKTFLATELNNKLKNRAAIAFAVALLRSAAAVEAAQDVVSTTLAASVTQGMAAAAAHRPRPEVFAALATHGSEAVVTKLAAATAAWKDLEKCASGALAESLATLMKRAGEASAQRLAEAIVKQCNLTRLVNGTVAQSKLLAAMKERGFAEQAKSTSALGKAAEFLDAAEGKVDLMTSNTNAATEKMIQRRVADIVPRARAPLVAVVDSDSDDDKPTRKKSRKTK
jgi:hypothetical protein